MQEPASSPPAVAAALLEGGSPAQADLLARLRAGDRAAFAELVDAWSPVLLRVARLYVSTHAGRVTVQEMEREFLPHLLRAAKLVGERLTIR